MRENGDGTVGRKDFTAFKRSKKIGKAKQQTAAKSGTQLPDEPMSLKTKTQFQQSMPRLVATRVFLRSTSQRMLSSVSKDALTTQDAEDLGAFVEVAASLERACVSIPYPSDAMISYQTLVQDAAFPPGFEREFCTLGPVFKAAAERETRNCASMNNVDSAVWLHRYEKAEDRQV